MNNQDLAQCKKILERMAKHPFAGPFLEPVDAVALGIPDYLTVIKHPMDFGTITTKINQGAYQERAQYASDMRLVFNNCRTYNMPGSEIYRMADILSSLFEKAWKSSFPDDKSSPPQNNPATTFHGVNFSTPQPTKKRGRPKGSRNKRLNDDFDDDENPADDDEFSDDSVEAFKGSLTDNVVKTRSRRRSSRHDDAEFDNEDDDQGGFSSYNTTKKDRPKRNNTLKNYNDFYDDALYDYEEELITETTSKPKKPKTSPSKPAEDSQPLDPSTVTVANDVLVVPETPPPKPKPPKETGPVLSPYELARLKNIERNRELMKQLQLDALSSSFNKTLSPQVAVTTDTDNTTNAANYTPRKVKPKYLVDPSQRRVSKRNKGFELTPLYMSIRDRDHEKFNQLISGQILSNGKKIPLEVNKKQGVNDETCLHLACDLGDEAFVKQLLQCDDIDVNAKDHRGWGPLDVAKSNGFHAIGQLLQAQGATSYLQHAKKPLTPRVWTPTGFGPMQEPTGGRCSCCHICRSSLSRRPNEFKACSSCSYIFCRPCCTKKLGLEWDSLKSNHSWMCEVCMGRCLCSRCITRGPPKWFGWKNADWNDPTTVEEQRKLYINKVKQRQIQMGYDVVDLKFGQLPQKPPQLEDSEGNQVNDNDNNNNNDSKDESLTSNASEASDEGSVTNNSNGPAANGSCSCCHVCRRSMKSYPRPFKPCSTCAYIVCVNCFGTRVKESWEHVKGLAQWSCPVCNGVCSCSRCKTRGPPAWFGNKKKAANNQKQQTQAAAPTPVKTEPVVLPPPAPVAPPPLTGESEHSDGEGESDSEDNEENSDNEDEPRFAEQEDGIQNDSMQLHDTSDLVSDPIQLPTQPSDDLLPSFNFDFVENDPIGMNHHL